MWAQIVSTELSRAATKNGEAARGGTELDWTFWVDWYDDVLAGRPRNILMMEEIALEVDWDQEPGNVLAHIEAIRGKHAAAALPNGEQVSVNPETGKLRVDPVSEMRGEIMPEVLSKLDSILETPEFKEVESNQYNSLSSELYLLRQGRAFHGEAPRLLHSICVRVSARLQNKIHNAVCPAAETDANIADFQNVLTDVIADLTSFDPKVKEAVKAKLAVRFELDQAKIDPVATANDAISNISEGVLAHEMPELAEVLRDPGASDAEKAEAWYVSSSRLLRIWVIAGYSGLKRTADEVEWWSARGVKISANFVLIGGSVTAPAWLPAAIKAILAVM